MSQQLFTVDPSEPLLLLIANSPTAAEASWGWQESGLTVRNVRGRKMHNVDALFDEFAAALQFPHYFGENWASFEECLADMDGLSSHAGIAVVIFGAADVLIDAAPVELEVFVRIVTRAAETYPHPIDKGEWWDRPAVPFHIILQAVPEDVATVHSRWQTVGAELLPVKPI